MSAGESPYHHGNVPTAIVEAALGLIEEKGVESFTLREAARAIGVTHGAVYRHFEDKRALLAAIARDGFERLAQAMAEAGKGAGANPLKRVEAMAVAYLGFALENRAHYQVMFGQRLNADERFPDLEAAIMAALRTLRDEVQQGLEAKRIAGPDARTVAFTIWSVAHGYTTLLLNGRIYTEGPRDSERFFAALLKPVLKGIAGPKG